MKRNKKLVYGRTLLVGDAAGLVAHTSGEGIYFSMAPAPCGKRAHRLLRLQRQARNVREELAEALRCDVRLSRFLEHIAYTRNFEREWFTDMCRVDTVQELTFDGYLFKDIATVKPFDHLDLMFEGAVGAVTN